MPDALVGLAETALAHGPRPVEAGDIHQVVIHIDYGALAATSAATGPTGGSLNGGVCHLHDGPALHPGTLRRETCAGATTCTVTNGVDGTPMDVGRATRRVPARLRRAVTDRAGGRCQYPGCRRKAWLQIHHVRHWLDGGPTAYANLALLCSRHHRAHHTGRYGITHDTRAAGHFRFHLADGTPIPQVPEPPTLVGALADQHSARMAPETIQPDWHDRLDLDYAVSVFTCRPAA